MDRKQLELEEMSHPRVVTDPLHSKRTCELQPLTRELHAEITGRINAWLVQIDNELNTLFQAFMNQLNETHQAIQVRLNQPGLS